jgi:hypothetical protein
MRNKILRGIPEHGIERKVPYETPDGEDKKITEKERAGGG